MSEVGNGLENAEDLGKSPTAVVKRWLLELKLADKTEKEWRSAAEKTLKLYRGQNSKKNSVNILWANTETLRPSIYNSLPKPDVRRRFRDEDPMGKCVSEVLERAASYSIDVGGMDSCLKACVLDMLLPGRAVARIRYVPTIEGETHEDEIEESENFEELTDEQVEVEYVQWDDFRHGPGKTWKDVQWIAFRHRLTRDELIEKFGEEIGKSLKLDAPTDEDVVKADSAVAYIFKTLAIWEVWDKDSKEVLFISEGWKKEPLSIIADPLQLEEFFPCPEPLRAIEDNSSLIPIILYDLYKEQAEELDRVSARINKLIDALRVRGLYDTTLKEMAQLMESQDNSLIPAENVTAMLERGGLEKAIWMMPIEIAAMVLKELYVQRDQTIKIIYEITGMADITRGSSDPRETAAAQKIKTQWGTMRLQRMQRDFQRFTRDLVRLMAEVIGNKFQQTTLQKMTGLPYPTAQQQQQAQMQLQQIQQQAQQNPQAQPPQPPPQLMQVLNQPSWESILEEMRGDAKRSYRVDIETDSTIASTLEGDMQGLQEVLTGVVNFIQGIGPAVQMQAFPIEGVKEIVSVICRRARMGQAVEDALDKIQQPPPPPDPNAGEQAKMQAQMQSEQQKMQMTAQTEQMKAEFEQQGEQVKAQAAQQIEAAQAQANMISEQARARADMQVEQHRAEMQAQTDHMQRHYDSQLEQFKTHMQSQTDIILARLNNEAKIEVAEVAANATLQAAQISAAKQAETE